jgi:hypothetical protein
MGSQLFGQYYVVPTAAAIASGWKLFKGSASDYYTAREHVLKLAYWPDDQGDLDWDWVKTLEKHRIGELRIDEEIGGCDNLRAIFFKPQVTIESDPKSIDGDVMKRIWIISVFQKKTKGFSSPMMKAWVGMKKVIINRHYGGNGNA